MLLSHFDHTPVIQLIPGLTNSDPAISPMAMLHRYHVTPP
jgi:hypothetical protein